MSYCPQHLVDRLENGSLEAGSFHHSHHVQVAWYYLKHYDSLTAITKMTQGLKRFAKSIGKPDLFHTTITWGYMFLIKQRMAENPKGDFEQFAIDNRDLMQSTDPVINRYYSKELLKSDYARRDFALPDLVPQSLPAV